MDEKFTQHLQQYLASDSPDIAEGAELLLRLNHNRFLHARILRHPEYMRSKLMSELRHYLRIRLDGMTRQDIVRMEREVLPKAEESLAEGAPQTGPEETASNSGSERGDDNPEAGPDDSGPAEGIALDPEVSSAQYRGKRQDHELLPPQVQAIYDRNGEVYRRMKRTFETLKQMNDRPACDRYEYLKQLKMLDDEYRNNWDVYDHYQLQVGESIASMVESATVGSTPSVQVVTPKQVSSARKFLSVNHAKLASLDNEAKRAIVIEKMQERVDLLLSAGESFDPDFRSRLEADGLSFPS